MASRRRSVVPFFLGSLNAGLMTDTSWLTHERGEFTVF